jgi:GTP-binding protein HflX
MSYKIPEPTVQPKDRAFLVGVELKQGNDLLSLDDSLAELELLADTAGLDVVGQATLRRLSVLAK